jgi:hypothetical protein
MMRPRLVTVVLALTWLATMAAPCFALGADRHAPMACCETMGPGACSATRFAEPCCPAGQASEHEQQIQATTTGVTKLLDVSISSVPGGALPTPMPRLSTSLWHADRVPISPPRHCPLLI